MEITGVLNSMVSIIIHYYYIVIIGYIVIVLADVMSTGTAYHIVNATDVFVY